MKIKFAEILFSCLDCSNKNGHALEIVCKTKKEANDRYDKHIKRYPDHDCAIVIPR